MRSTMRRDLVRAEALAEVERPEARYACIPVVEMNAGEHRFGSYIIRLEREGAGFSYEVCTRKAVVVAGFDLLSLTEQDALDGITARLSGKGQP